MLQIGPERAIILAEYKNSWGIRLGWLAWMASFTQLGVSYMAESAFGLLGYEAVNPAYVALTAASAGQPAIPLLSGAPPSADQFMLFQLGNAEHPICDLTEVAPQIEGSTTEPDVQVSVAMLAFHLARNTAESLKEKSRATLRLDLGKDEGSNSQMEALFWSIASGLDLYEHVRGGANANTRKKMSDDFSAKFRQRPVEIPGGLGQLRIEIVEHVEPPWWRRAIGFVAEDSSVKRIISSIGFPGIALEAVRLLDEMIGRFEDAAARPILRSRPMTLAFSKAARDDYTAGSEAARIGCVAPGFYVLVRHQDTAVFNQSPPVFLGHTAHLVPRAEWEKNPAAINPDSTPYGDATYAVLRFRSRGTKLGGL
jgi:hypothetical protein